MKNLPGPSPARIALVAAWLLLLLGCAQVPTLAPAPNLYANSTDNPYAAVPKEWQTGSATLLYATDRQPETIKGVYGYGYKRAREVAFGQCTVRIGENATWEQIVAASRTREGPQALPLALTGIEERGRYPALKGLVKVNGQWVDSPEYIATTAQAMAEAHRLLAEQLAKTPRKEVYLFVHGFNNDFAWAATTTAQLWHFLGREGVPILYSWPAGSGSLLRGYTHDRESGEFTNAHLKQILRAVASCPQVQKVHLIGHSRGTDVLGTALRELHVEYRGAGKNTRTELKLGQVVLAAPDIDLDVFIERFGADRVGFVPEQMTIYVSHGDQAIGLSTWLFGSARRIGQLSFGDLGEEAAAAVRQHPVMTLVNVTAQTKGNGHDYFLSNPAALSDLILVLRYHKAPGAANGRPLLDHAGKFLEIDDHYPQFKPGPATNPKP